MERIEVVLRRLSDGSEAWDVVYGNRLLPAVTMHDAAELAQKIQLAIHDHTNETAEIVWSE